MATTATAWQKRATTTRGRTLPVSAAVAIALLGLGIAANDTSSPPTIRAEVIALAADVQCGTGDNDSSSCGDTQTRRVVRFSWDSGQQSSGHLSQLTQEQQRLRQEQERLRAAGVRHDALRGLPNRDPNEPQPIKKMHRVQVQPTSGGALPGSCTTQC